MSWYRNLKVNAKLGVVYGLVIVMFISLIVAVFGISDRFAETSSFVFHLILIFALLSAGSIIGIVISLREVKATMRREHEVNEMNEIFHNASPFIMNIWDDTITLVSTSPQAVKMFGLSSQEQYIERFNELSPEYQPCGASSYEKAGNFVKQAFDEGYVQFEWMHQNLSGEALPTEVTLVRFKRNGKYFVAAYTTDLRPIKSALERERQLELKLQEQEISGRIQLMLDAAPLMIEYWDQDYNAIDCNQAILNFYNFSDKAEYIEKHETIVPNLYINGVSSSDRWMKHLGRIFKNGQGRFDFAQLNLNNETVLMEVEGIRINYNDTLIVVTYAKDVTLLKEMQQERRRIEVVEESNRAKSRFLARMSHEIRTPITAVMGISEIQLQNLDLPPLIEESFAKIHSSSILLLGIINDILDLSKIEAGKMELVCEKYNVASMVSDVAHLHLAYLGSKDIVFSMNVDEELPAYLEGDPLRIGQIMNNIISNAFKYTKSGTVELSLQCLKDEEDVEQVTLIICVQDTGMGMTPEQVNALYSDYTRFHERGNLHISGTGLGMPIVYSLAQMMNAYIELDSEVGKGTSVIVYIPQKVASPEVLGRETVLQLQQFEPCARTAAKRFDFTPEPMPYGRVLVVDDVEANLYVARGLLAFYKLNIEICESGYEAIEKIRQGNVYDIIFMDHMMPGLDGIETMRIMRTMRYPHPIVALTANALIGQAEAFIKDGFDGFISKPIRTKHLNTILIRHIRDKQPPEVIEAALANAEAETSLKTAKDSHSTESIDNFQDRADVLEKLRADFARGQKNVFLDICNALNAGDNKTAHLLAHTLKGLAGLINEETLANNAAVVERLLDVGETPTVEQFNDLEVELTKVLDSIGKPKGTMQSISFPSSENFDRAGAIILLDKLAPLLEAHSVDCFDYLDELRNVPEAAILCRQIKEFDFQTALKNVTALRAIFSE